MHLTFLPAWMIGNNPELKIIQATHTAELAVNFGRKTKNLIDSKEYQDLFATRLQEDSPRQQDDGTRHKVVNTLQSVSKVR